MPDPVTVVCVRVGDLYGVEYVTRLRAMVARNLSLPHRFDCFSDENLSTLNDMGDIECQPAEDLPGWWAKLGLFRPDLPIEGPFLYLDLDVLVVRSLDQFFEPWCDFATIKQRKRIKSPKTVPMYNSSAMYFAHAGVRSKVWSGFNPRRHMHEFRGDQDWLGHICPHEATFPTWWFAPVGPERPGPQTKVVLCNDVPNHVAGEFWPWVKDAWG